ncbi:MAG: IgGFc-binding protein, partial [Bacteroidota bacterium]|nr:IgGFc-binding protein [Bacteroidota bacterium]
MTTTVGRLLVGMVVGGSMLWSAGVVVAQGGEVCFQRFKNSNVGTEFYFSFPPCFEDEAFGGQNNVVIYIASWVRGKVKVEVTAKGFLRELYTIPNDVVEVVLTPEIGQPYRKRGTQDPPSEDEPYRAAGIRVVAEVPVAVYGVTRYVYTTDAFMVIPVSMLGTEYVIASYPDMVGMYMPWYTNIPSETVIVAAHDNTEVFFTLYGNPSTRTSGGMRPGQTKRWTLNKGDVVAIGTVGPEADLSGSLVRATKPVAVVSGNQCTNVPTSIRWCDFTCEMELPTYAWGRTYFVTPIFGGSRFRGQNSVIRIFAKESNTKVYLDGQEWAVIRRGPGGMRGEGWLDIEDPDPAEVRPIVISADKPIQVVQYNKGQESDWIPTDPFEMALPSLEQSQTHVIFATPGAAGGAVAPFGRNFINLVFPLNEDGTVPSDLEFGELRGGQIVWTPVRSRFDPTRVPFRIRVNGRLWAFKVLRLPNTGAFQIRSRSGNFPFMAYSYGGSDYDSYGFVTTMAFGKMLDPADTLPPLVTWSQRCDGFVEGFAVDRPGEA